MMSLVFTNSSPAVSPTRARGEFQFQSVIERGTVRRWTFRVEGTDLIACFWGTIFSPLHNSYPSGEGCQS